MKSDNYLVIFKLLSIGSVLWLISLVAINYINQQHMHKWSNNAHALLLKEYDKAWNTQVCLFHDGGAANDPHKQREEQKKRQAQFIKYFKEKTSLYFFNTKHEEFTGYFTRTDFWKCVSNELSNNSNKISEIALLIFYSIAFEWIGDDDASANFGLIDDKIPKNGSQEIKIVRLNQNIDEKWIDLLFKENNLYPKIRNSTSNNLYEMFYKISENDSYKKDTFKVPEIN